MKKPMYFDPAKAEAAIAQLEQLHAPYLNDPHYGSQSRFATAVMPSFYRALVRETNRGTSDGAIRSSAAALCSNIIATVAKKNPERVQDVLEEIMRMLSTPVVEELVVEVKGQEGGNA